MPTYRIKDPLTGKTLKVTGDTPPTEQELDHILASVTPHQGPEIADSFAGKQAVGDETDNPDKAYWDSLKDTASTTVGGAVRGAANTLSSMVEQAQPSNWGNLAMSGLRRLAHPVDTARNTVEGLRKIVTGDPSAGGEAIGALATGLASPGIPKVAQAEMSAAPSVMRGAGRVTEAVGRGTEALGKSAGRMGRYGVIPTAITGHPVAAVTELVAPPLIRGGGRVMQKAGRGMRNLGDMMDSLRETPVKEAAPVGEGSVMADGFPSGVGTNVQEGEIIPNPSPELPPHRPVTEAGPVPYNPADDVSPTARWQGNDLPSTRPPQEPAIEGELVDMPSQPIEAGPSSQFGAPRLPEPTLERRLPERGSGRFEMPPSTLEPQTFEGQSPVASSMQRMMESNPTAELGMPRVKSWKDGKGPTQADMQKARDYGGGKDAASRLKVPQSRVYAETSKGSGVPLEVQQRIKAKVAGMSGEDFKAYARNASTPDMRKFIQSLRP